MNLDKTSFASTAEAVAHYYKQGFESFGNMRYRSEHEVLNGWIEKRGRKWLHCFFPGAGRKKLRKDEERYMTPL